MKTVGFEKRDIAFDSPASSDSSLRRIQRFMATYVLDTGLTALVIFCVLLSKDLYSLRYLKKRNKKQAVMTGCRITKSHTFSCL